MIRWCPNCNNITTEETCLGCKDIKTIFISNDIRPVFVYEKAILSALLNENVMRQSVWNITTGYYLINGVKRKIVMRELLKNIDISELKEKFNYYLMYKQEEDFSGFIEANKNRLNEITYKAQKYIQNLFKQYNNYVKIISWSGGKDSTVVGDLVVKSLINPDDEIYFVHSNTTMEFPSTEQYIKDYFSNSEEVNFYPLIIAESDKDFMNLCNEFGPPSRVMRWCCTIFKTGPISQIYNDIFPDKEILTFYGIRKKESKSRSKYKNTVNSPKISRQIVSSPILDWYDFDIWLYILSNKIKFNKAYKLGFSRVGCLYCPNNGIWSEFLSEFYYPSKYQKWKNYLYGFAKEIGKPDYKNYVDEGWWKARQGGNGIQKDYNTLNAHDCNMKENAKNYFLSKPIDYDIFDYFKVFGLQKYVIDKNNNFKMTIKNSENDILLEGKINGSVLKVSIIKTSNVHLLFQRIECQLRKFQFCIRCSACDSLCPVGAISTKLNRYVIDEQKCIQCGKCISKFTGGCLLSKSLVQSKK